MFLGDSGGGECVDDAEWWHKKSKKNKGKRNKDKKYNCDWVAKKSTKKRCEKKNNKGVHASVACACACAAYA